MSYYDGYNNNDDYYNSNGSYGSYDPYGSSYDSNNYSSWEEQRYEESKDYNDFYSNADYRNNSWYDELYGRDAMDDWRKRSGYDGYEDSSTTTSSLSSSLYDSNSITYGSSSSGANSSRASSYDAYGYNDGYCSGAGYHRNVRSSGARRPAPAGSTYIGRSPGSFLHFCLVILCIVAVFQCHSFFIGTVLSVFSFVRLVKILDGSVSRDSSICVTLMALALSLIMILQ